MQEKQENQNKYYTPDISEFHVGFEYECSSDKGELWYSVIIEQLKDYLTLEDDLRYDLVRVKYLDKEDIEGLGFEHVGSLWFKDINNFKIRKWKDRELDIYKHYISDNEDQLIFRGSIKNKSELVKLLKQLGVNA